MKSWISAERQAVWRRVASWAFGVEEGTPSRMLERIVPSNKEGSWETRERCERWVEREVWVMSVEWRKIWPRWGV